MASSLVVNDVTIRQPTNDVRSFRIFRDSRNDLEIIVCSDPTATMAAASMCVDVGQFDGACGKRDGEIQGLAHLCEHLVVCGSTATHSGSFMEFCSSVSGFANAKTAMNETTYYYRVPPHVFHDSLLWFCSFFAVPLLSEDIIENEKHAVESEHSKNKLNDAIRLNYLMRHTANPNHPYSSFGTGNWTSLHDEPLARGVDVSARLREFYNREYSTGKMRLAVVGPQNLDVLQQWIEEATAPIPQRLGESNADRVIPDDPFGASWRNVYCTVLAGSKARIILDFPFPSQISTYKTKIYRLFSFLLGHEGEGSILLYLKQQGWATSLVAGLKTHTKELAIFDIEIEATDKGIAEASQVVSVVFEYLGCISRATDDELERIWREIYITTEQQFMFPKKLREDELVSMLSLSMHRFDKEDVLYGTYCVSQALDCAAARRYVKEHFGIENLRLTIAVPHSLIDAIPSELEKATEWQIEPYYEMQYSSSPFPSHWIDQWTRGMQEHTVPTLHFPPPNPFIATDLELRTTAKSQRLASDDVSREASESDGFGRFISEPMTCVTTCGVRVWHLLHLELPEPKAAICLQLTHGRWNATAHAAALRMTMECFQEIINHWLYLAEEAGIYITANNASGSGFCNGLRILISGLSHGLPTAFKELIKEIRSLDQKISEDVFLLMQHKVVVDYENRALQQPYVHAFSQINRFVERVHYSDEERRVAVGNLTVDDVRSYARDMVRDSLVEMVYVGNVTATEAETAVKEACDTEFRRDVDPVDDKFLQMLQPPVGTVCLHQRAPNAAEENSAVVLHLTVGPETLRSSVLLDLSWHLVEQHMFQQLRSNERLGYIVAAYVQRSLGVQALRLIVQSKLSPIHVLSRIDAFLTEFTQQIDEILSVDKFHSMVQGLIARKLSPYKSVKEHAETLAEEVASNSFCWDKRVLECRELRTVSREELTAFFKQHISPGGEERRAVAGCIWGSAAQQQQETNLPQDCADRVWLDGQQLADGGVETKEFCATYYPRQGAQQH